MSDPAVQDLAPPPKAAANASIPSPGSSAGPGAGRGSWWLRLVIAVIAVGAVVLWLRSRHQERSVSPAGGAAGSDRTEHAASDAGGGGRGGGRRGGGGEGGDAEGRVVTVQVAPAERKDLPIWLEGLGTVAAVQQVTVHPQVDGRLDKVLFVEGQPVKKGDVLAQIDPRPFLVALHQAEGALARDKAQLETNQSNLKRYEGLQAQNLVAGQQVEEIAGQVGQFAGSVKIDQAQIENAQLQLDYAQIKVPLDGIAGVRQVDAGNIIHQTDPNGLVVITAIDPAAVFFTLPQDQLAAVAQALARGEVPVEAYSRDGATKLATGKLAVLDNQINQATATLRLKALMPNPDRGLWPNAFVKARMLVETRKGAIVIPAVAVQRGPQGTYVYAVGADHVAQMKTVTIAMTTGDVAVVGSGLAGGEQVIVEGQNQVRPGGRVAPSGANDPGGSGSGSSSGPGRPSPGGERGRGKRGEANADEPPSPPDAAPPAGGRPGGVHGAAPPAGAAAQRPPVTGKAESVPRGPAAGPTASNQPAAP
jgi:membrane fusion protein, multidrug efflux system